MSSLFEKQSGWLAVVVLAALITTGCRSAVDRPVSAARDGSLLSDSTRLVAMATNALYAGISQEDRFPMKVLRFVRDSAGVEITLGFKTPPGTTATGGGVVRITTEGDVRVVSFGH